MFIGLIGAMEEVDNTTAEVDLGAAGETAVAVADESAEIQKDNTAIDVTVGQVEEAVQAGDELESIGEVAVDSVESGEGMSEQTAELAEIAIESICNRLSYRPAVRLVPAVESSFGNNASRLTSTKIIIENIGDTLKKIWASIKAAALRVWDMVKSFIANMFKSTAMLAKHIDGLRKRARMIDDAAEPDSKTLKSGAAKAFSVKKTADLNTYKEILKNTSKISEAVQKLSATRVAIAEIAKGFINNGNVVDADTIVKYMNDIKDKNATVKTTVGNAFVSMKSNLADVTKDSKAEGNVETHTYGPFVNSGVLILKETTKDIGQGKIEVHGASLRFSTEKDSTASEISALDKSQILEVLETAAKLINALNDTKKTSGLHEKMVKDSVKSAEDVMNNAEKILAKTGGKTEQTLAFAAIKDEVKESIAQLGIYGAKAPSMIFQFCKYSADWASVSMRNLKVK